MLARRLRPRSWSYIGVARAGGGAGGRAQRETNSRAQRGSAPDSRRVLSTGPSQRPQLRVSDSYDQRAVQGQALSGFSRRILRMGRYHHSLRFIDVKTGSERLRNSPESQSRCAAERGDISGPSVCMVRVCTRVHRKRESHKPPNPRAKICTEVSLTVRRSNSKLSECGRVSPRV